MKGSAVRIRASALGSQATGNWLPPTWPTLPRRTPWGDVPSRSDSEFSPDGEGTVGGRSSTQRQPLKRPRLLGAARCRAVQSPGNSGWRCPPEIAARRLAMLNRTELLRTRLRPPRLPPGTLDRPALIDRALRGVDRGRLLVVAGAGYGKSTFLAQVVERVRVPAVWCSCDARMTETSALLLHITAGFEEAIPGFGASLRLQGLRSTRWPACATRSPSRSRTPSSWSWTTCICSWGIRRQTRSHSSSTTCRTWSALWSPDATLQIAGGGHGPERVLLAGPGAI